MAKITDKITVAVLFGNRGFFPSYLVGDARREASAIFETMGLNAIMLTEEQTAYGGVETYQDAKIAAELLKNIAMKSKGSLYYCLTLATKKQLLMRSVCLVLMYLY